MILTLPKVMCACGAHSSLYGYDCQASLAVQANEVSVLLVVSAAPDARCTRGKRANVGRPPQAAAGGAPWLSQPVTDDPGQLVPAERLHALVVLADVGHVHIGNGERVALGLSALVADGRITPVRGAGELPALQCARLGILLP